MIYLDGTALCHFLPGVRHGDAWAAWVAEHENELVTSPLGLTELRQAAALYPREQLAEVTAVVERVRQLVPQVRFSDDNVTISSHATSVLKPFAALHIGAAVGADRVDQIATYDPSVAHVAEIYRLKVVTPGMEPGWYLTFDGPPETWQPISLDAPHASEDEFAVPDLEPPVDSFELALKEVEDIDAMHEGPATPTSGEGSLAVGDADEVPPGGVGDSVGESTPSPGLVGDVPPIPFEADVSAERSSDAIVEREEATEPEAEPETEPEEVELPAGAVEREEPEPEEPFALPVESTEGGASPAVADAPGAEIPVAVVEPEDVPAGGEIYPGPRIAPVETADSAPPSAPLTLAPEEDSSPPLRRATTTPTESTSEIAAPAAEASVAPPDIPSVMTPPASAGASSSPSPTPAPMPAPGTAPETESDASRRRAEMIARLGQYKPKVEAWKGDAEEVSSPVAEPAARRVDAAPPPAPAAAPSIEPEPAVPSMPSTVSPTRLHEIAPASPEEAESEGPAEDAPISRPRQPFRVDSAVDSLAAPIGEPVRRPHLHEQPAPHAAEPSEPSEEFESIPTSFPADVQIEEPTSYAPERFEPGGGRLQAAHPFSRAGQTAAMDAPPVAPDQIPALEPIPAPEDEVVIDVPELQPQGQQPTPGETAPSGKEEKASGSKRWLGRVKGKGSDEKSQGKKAPHASKGKGEAPPDDEDPGWKLEDILGPGGGPH